MGTSTDCQLMPQARQCLMHAGYLCRPLSACSASCWGSYFSAARQSVVLLQCVGAYLHSVCVHGQHGSCPECLVQCRPCMASSCWSTRPTGHSANPGNWQRGHERSPVVRRRCAAHVHPLGHYPKPPSQLTLESMVVMAHGLTRSTCQCLEIAVGYSRTRDACPAYSTVRLDVVKRACADVQGRSCTGIWGTQTGWAE